MLPLLKIKSDILLFGNISKIRPLTCTSSKDNYIDRCCSGIGTKGQLPFLSVPQVLVAVCASTFDLHRALWPWLPPYSTNSWRVREVKSCIQSSVCTLDCLTTGARPFWWTGLDPSFLCSFLGVGLWTWDSWLFNCFFPWPLSSSQRTPASPPQTQPSQSGLCLC